MNNYMTPDVYVKEESTLASSVTEVQSAIPVFIGRTEMAEYKGESLLNTPKRISSLADYQMMFGAYPPNLIDKITLTGANHSVTGVSRDRDYYLFSALRMFYLNGGGPAWIISTGDYSSPLKQQEMLDGLKLAEKETEITLLVMPDLAGMSVEDSVLVQQQMLAQANERGDRFALLDLPMVTDPLELDDTVKEYRTQIGTTGLKYGGVYGPYLVSGLAKHVGSADILGHLQENTGNADNPVIGDTTLIDLDPNPAVGKIVASLTQVNNAGAAIKGAYPKENAVSNAGAKLLSALSVAPDAAAQLTAANAVVASLHGYATGVAAANTKATKTPGAYGPDINAFIIRNYTGVAKALSEIKVGSTSLVTASAVPGADALATAKTAQEAAQKSVNDAQQALADAQTKAKAAPTDQALAKKVTDADAALKTAQKGLTDKATAVEAAQKTVDAAAAPTYSLAATAPTLAAGDLQAFLTDPSREAVQKGFSVVEGFLSKAKSSCGQLASGLESALVQASPLYTNILGKVTEKLQTLPPSGAMAGVIAQVDASRGAWKAPANVSVSMVKKLALNITAEMQQTLNVDVIGGKSINAIRTLPGRGIMVWGARTLLGNDNEWRYVSVKRFYIVAEQSIKNSSSWAVFEPNDAKLWIKMKTMIANYLTDKWKEGALAGSKPEQAFEIKVGLGETMTAEDILQGKLIVQIGMAVVRPAEFIVLRFTQKMQQA